MEAQLSQEQIGQRILKARKSKGFSQEELAALLEISRSALTQIELGNRGVNILEFHKLSLILGFSLDEIMSTAPYAGDKIEKNIVNENTAVYERISTPTLNLEKFKNVLLYILEKCAGKPNVGETVLYKLLYFSDFNYFELYEEHLSGAKYKKLPFGPVPQKMNPIINQMIEEEKLKRIKTAFHGFPQTRYLPLEKANLKLLKASETEVLDRVIDQFSDWSATAISNYSHQDMPWLATKEGEEIDYELVFYREPPFSVRNYVDENES